MLYILAANLIWGSVGVFARWSGATPTVIVFFRLLIGFIALSLIGPWLNRPVPRGRTPGEVVVRTAYGTPAPRRPAHGRPAWMLIAAGLILALDWVFFFQALLTTTFLTTMVAYYTAPLMAAAAAPRLLGERGSRRTWIGLGLSFLGVTITSSPPPFASRPWRRC